MVRIKRSYRIRVCGTKICPLGELPSDSQQTDQNTKPNLNAKPVAVHRRSACSGVKARRNTSAAKRQAAKLCYRFGPLTPSARSANPDRRRRDEEPAFPLRTKNPTTNQKQLLDRKSPIRVRILFPPAESPSLSRICFRGSRTPALCAAVRGGLATGSA